MMRPFFRRYGGKWLLARYCPPPAHDLIIEPFAGAAGYSVRYGANRAVALFDTSPRVTAIWDWLLGASVADVLALPVAPIHAGADVRTLGLAKSPMLLIQSWLTTQGSITNWRMTPMLRASVTNKPGSVWSNRVRDRIAAQLPLISRWTITQAPFTAAPDVTATWHVDPPYQHNRYALSEYQTDPLDYAAMATWCQDRRGQVMVHEQQGATWAPFIPWRTGQTGCRRQYGTSKTCQEVLWQPHNAHLTPNDCE